jgi:hypothetical protein
MFLNAIERKVVMDKDLSADPLYRIDWRQLRHFLAAAK